MAVGGPGHSVMPSQVSSFSGRDPPRRGGSRGPALGLVGGGQPPNTAQAWGADDRQEHPRSHPPQPFRRLTGRLAPFTGQASPRQCCVSWGFLMPPYSENKKDPSPQPSTHNNLGDGESFLPGASNPMGAQLNPSSPLCSCPILPTPAAPDPLLGMCQPPRLLCCRPDAPRAPDASPRNVILSGLASSSTAWDPTASVWADLGRAGGH